MQALFVKVRMHYLEEEVSLLRLACPQFFRVFSWTTLNPRVKNISSPALKTLFATFKNYLSSFCRIFSFCPWTNFHLRDKTIFTLSLETLCTTFENMEKLVSSLMQLFVNVIILWNGKLSIPRRFFPEKKTFHLGKDKFYALMQGTELNVINDVTFIRFYYFSLSFSGMENFPFLN